MLYYYRKQLKNIVKYKKSPLQSTDITKDLSKLTTKSVFRLLHELLCYNCKQHSISKFQRINELFTIGQMLKKNHMNESDLFLKCNICGTGLHFLCILKYLTDSNKLDLNHELKFEQIEENKLLLLNLNWNKIYDKFNIRNRSNINNNNNHNNCQLLDTKSKFDFYNKKYIQSNGLACLHPNGNFY